MYSKFFYDFSFQQYQLAYNSYKSNGSSINELIKTLFTIIILIFGYAHYLFSVEEYSPFIFVYLSLAIFIGVVLYGLFFNLPKEVPFLNPKFFYDEYYELDLTDQEFNFCLAQIIANLVEDTITLNEMADNYGKKLRAMQFATIVGLLFLGLSLLEYII